MASVGVNVAIRFTCTLSMRSMLLLGGSGACPSENLKIYLLILTKEIIKLTEEIIKLNVDLVLAT